MMICATPSQFFGSVKYSALSPSATEAITHRLPRFLREKCQGELVLLIFFYSIHRICEGKQPIGDLVGETWGNWGAWDKVDTKLCPSNKFSFKIFVGAHSDPVLPENPSTNWCFVIRKCWVSYTISGLFREWFCDVTSPPIGRENHIT